MEGVHTVTVRMSVHDATKQGLINGPNIGQSS